LVDRISGKFDTGECCKDRSVAHTKNCGTSTLLKSPKIIITNISVTLRFETHFIWWQRTILAYRYAQYYHKIKF